MPSPRRIRLLGLAAMGLTILILFYTSRANYGQDGLQDFYHKTKNAMDEKDSSGQVVIDSQSGNKGGHIPADRDGDGDVDADDKESAIKMQERLKEAEQEAKDNANKKAGPRPDPPTKVVGVGSSAEGQDKKGDVDAEQAGDSKPLEKDSVKSKDERDAEVELASILKKAPVTIFSKTYCPFSKRAKGILLDKLTISPVPNVVELDQHPLGPHLQDLLEKTTGRRTVPNVLVNGKSIGGGDDIVALDNDDKLVTKIIGLGSSRVTVSERLTGDESHN